MRDGLALRSDPEANDRHGQSTIPQLDNRATTHTSPSKQGPRTVITTAKGYQYYTSKGGCLGDGHGGHFPVRSTTVPVPNTGIAVAGSQHCCHRLTVLEFSVVCRSQSQLHLLLLLTRCF
jgi:hypothetical protein